MTNRDTGYSHVLDEMIDRIGQKVEAAGDAQRVDSHPTADKPDRHGPGTIAPSGGAHFRNHLQPHPATLYRDDHDDWDPPWVERVPRSACWDEHTYLMMNDLHPAKLIDGETWIDCDEQEQPPAGEQPLGQTHVWKGAVDAATGEVDQPEPRKPDINSVQAARAVPAVEDAEHEAMLDPQPRGAGHQAVKAPKPR